jgi:phosphatidylserine/phosphatidylglycerophosphate/cardiolipin synthase-like enzyme
MRSLKLNDEASLNIYDAGFALEMIRAFEEDLARSEPCTWEAWRPPAAGAGGGAPRSADPVPALTPGSRVEGEAAVSLGTPAPSG